MLGMERVRNNRRQLLCGHTLGPPYCQLRRLTLVAKIKVPLDCNVCWIDTVCDHIFSNSCCKHLITLSQAADAQRIQHTVNALGVVLAKVGKQESEGAEQPWE